MSIEDCLQVFIMKSYRRIWQDSLSVYCDRFGFVEFVWNKILTCGERPCCSWTGRSLMFDRNLLSKSWSKIIAWPFFPARAVLPTLWIYWSLSDGNPTCKIAYLNIMMHLNCPVCQKASKCIMYPLRTQIFQPLTHSSTATTILFWLYFIHLLAPRNCRVQSYLKIWSLQSDNYKLWFSMHMDIHKWYKAW